MSFPVPDFPGAGPRVLIDADACPVKEEVQKVCFRRKVPMLFVSNQYLRLPQHPLAMLLVAGSGFDEADDRKRFHVSPKGIVLITPEMLGQDYPHGL